MGTAQVIFNNPPDILRTYIGQCATCNVLVFVTILRNSQLLGNCFHFLSEPHKQTCNCFWWLARLLVTT